MKERVVDVDQTQGSQVARMAQTMEEKLNALDVRIAKAKFELDENLPQLSEKNKSIENQMAKLSAGKADIKALETAVTKLDKRIKTNAGQHKTTLAAMERINRQLLDAIKENNIQFKTKADQIAANMQLFKEEFDARLMELSVYEQQIAQLGKDVSLLEKELKTIRQDTDQTMSRNLTQLRGRLEKMILDLDKKITSAQAAAAKPVAPASPGTQTQPAANTSVRPSQAEPIQPQPDIGRSGGTSISEETLTQ